jgi:long-subunit fatty acid transport protein
MEEQPMKVIRLLGRAAATALVLCASAPSAFAQSNDEVFPQFQFNFSTPGARANAMGRTFIGIADDASASITNPAGLMRLSRRQLYVEFKSTDLEVERLAGLRSLATTDTETFGDTTGAIGFLSFSSPIGERFAVAFTRHQFLDHHETFTLQPRPIPPDFSSVFFPVRGESDFTGVSYAGSVAMTVNPQLQVGVTLSYDRFSADSVATRFDLDFVPPFGDFDVVGTDVIANRTSIDDDSSGLSMTLGALITPNDKVTIGVQYAKGATFEVEETLATNDNFPFSNGAMSTVEGFPKTVTINVPDRIGFGVSFRPTSRLLAAVDIVHIGYSSLADDFTLIFDADEFTADNFEVDNVTEFHAGAEYLAMTSGNRRVFVRAGLFTSPDHRTRFIEGPDPEANASEVAKYNLLPDETDLVGSIGAGVAVGPRFQLDAAYIFGREFVLSAAVRF